MSTVIELDNGTAMMVHESIEEVSARLAADPDADIVSFSSVSGTLAVANPASVVDVRRPWVIVGGPGHLAADFDGERYEFVVDSGSGPEGVFVDISGTVLACDVETLQWEIGDAVRTQGRSIIEAHASDATLPRIFSVTSSNGITARATSQQPGIMARPRASARPTRRSPSPVSGSSRAPPGSQCARTRSSGPGGRPPAGTPPVASPS
jgi:hypothetical protein